MTRETIKRDAEENLVETNDEPTTLETLILITLYVIGALNMDIMLPFGLSPMIKSMLLVGGIYVSYLVYKKFTRKKPRNTVNDRVRISQQEKEIIKNGIQVIKTSYKRKTRFVDLFDTRTFTINLKKGLKALIDKGVHVGNGIMFNVHSDGRFGPIKITFNRFFKIIPLNDEKPINIFENMEIAEQIILHWNMSIVENDAMTCLVLHDEIEHQLKDESMSELSEKIDNFKLRTDATRSLLEKEDILLMDAKTGEIQELVPFEVIELSIHEPDLEKLQPWLGSNIAEIDRFITLHGETLEDEGYLPFQISDTKLSKRNIALIGYFHPFKKTWDKTFLAWKQDDKKLTLNDVGVVNDIITSINDKFTELVLMATSFPVGLEVLMKEPGLKVVKLQLKKRDSRQIEVDAPNQDEKMKLNVEEVTLSG